MNTRRHLIAAAGAGALTAPFATLAQAPAPAGKVWRVGFLAMPARPANIDNHFQGAFAQGMRELGYVDGKNLVIEYRFADNDASRLPGLAMELARLKPDVLVTSADPVWTLAPDWLTSRPALYASTHVRVLKVETLLP